MELKKISCLSLLFLILLSSCIKRFEPEIKNTEAVKYVVDGQVNQGDSVQVIGIFTTSPFIKPVPRPVSGCTVYIIDGKGNSYLATDMWNGKYEAIIPESELVPGATFKVDIQVSGGAHIVSDFDQVQDCPKLDSVYYVVKELPTQNPFYFTKGIQFYLDLNAENYSCRYYRWEAIETWEYHTLHPIEWYYDGKLHHVYPPDSSKKVCWRTIMVPNIFMQSTKDLVQNKYDKIPLQFVDNISSARLDYGYSLLIKQYSMSEAAYQYWEKARANSYDQGGLYESQPISIKGNLHNITNPDKEVLGYFGASTVTKKRIFVKNIPDMPHEYVLGCAITGLMWGLEGEDPIMYPLYLIAHHQHIGDSIISTYLGAYYEHECVDCTSTIGGTTDKPDYWPY